MDPETLLIHCTQLVIYGKKFILLIAEFFLNFFIRIRIIFQKLKQFFWASWFGIVFGRLHSTQVAY